MWTQIPAACLRPSWQARSCVSKTQKGHLRAWLFLAPSSGLRACTVAKIAAPILGSQADGESAARFEKCRSVAAKQLGCERSVGVSA